jgi:hypothetical protein
MKADSLLIMAVEDGCMRAERAIILLPHGYSCDVALRHTFAFAPECPDLHLHMWSWWWMLMVQVGVLVGDLQKYWEEHHQRTHDDDDDDDDGYDSDPYS